MAYANTHLDEYRLSRSLSNLDAAENRWSQFGGFQAFLDDTPNTLPGASTLSAEYDEHRTVSVLAMLRQTLATSATRTCSMTSTQATSTYITPSWTVLVTAFKMIPSEHKGNYMKYQEIFNFQMASVERAFLVALDGAAYTSLNTNKSTVNEADGNPYTVNGTNDMIVPAADNELFFNEAQAILDQNDLPSEAITVIASPRIAALARELNAQGPANDANRAFQFGPFSFYYSPRITVAAGDRDTAFIAPKGSLAFLSYVDQDSQMESKAGEHEWSVQFLPKLGINVGLLYSADCGDMSSYGGGANVSSKYESFQFSFDYSFIVVDDLGGGLGEPLFKAAFSKV
jgi:hypothetical protein